MSEKKVISKQMFLQIASSNSFSVHKYKDSFANKRKQAGRYEKEGLIKKVDTVWEFIHYEITPKGKQWLAEQKNNNPPTNGRSEG